MSSENKGAQIIVGAQWGDEGKGLISAYLTLRNNVGIVARAGTGPNAEHGLFFREKGPYLRVNQLPLGWMFNPDAQIRIGSGVAVNPEWLIKEMDRYDLQGRVMVDYRCPIITPEHIKAEAESKKMAAIGSTMSGTGKCRADFINRTAQQARDIPQLKPFLTDVSQEVNSMAANRGVTVESSQGTLLSLALSPDYPDVTSDNVTSMAAADDVGLSWKRIKDVVMVVKALPTREGSGPMGGQELSLEEMTRQDLVERSSIGGVPRRKAKGINLEMLSYAAQVNGATQIALTFVEHFDPRMTNATDKNQITDQVWQLIESVQHETGGVPVTVINTGKRYSSIIDLTGENEVDWQEVDRNLRSYASTPA